MSLGLNQTEFVEGIITPFDGPHQCQEISNKTINKWETGTAYPSLLQLFLLGESYNFSVKKLFDQFDSGFFVKSEIENIDRTYDIGLNYEFSRSTELEHWLRFVTLFKLAKRAISGFFNNFNILGEADIENCKSIISNVSYSDSEIVIELRNKSIISIPMEQVKIIEAKNVLNNLLYEFQLALGEETSRTIKLSFSFFVRDDTDE
jgi:transcriptional regulator with XRE-family HTH domain